MSGHILVDLDDTLVRDEYPAIGPLIPAMADRVRAWLAEGLDVRIFTARVAWNYDDDPRAPFDFQAFKRAIEQRRLIEAWTEQIFGQRLRVTCQKDFETRCLYDDRAVPIRAHGGIPPC